MGANHRRVFALPTALLNSANAAEAFADRDITALEASMAWALKTAGAHVGLDWEAPSRAIIQSWFAPEQLTVLAGALVRQGELVYESSELAIRFPIVPQLPPDLPEERLAWIRLPLDEAQNRWHLVRFGIIGGETESSVIAEVNLTGAPREILEDLFVTSLEALRWVVRWLGEPTDWLADVGVTSELLAVGPKAEP